jgi:hypothetical protein
MFIPTRTGTGFVKWTEYGVYFEFLVRVLVPGTCTQGTVEHFDGAFDRIREL